MSLARAKAKHDFTGKKARWQNEAARQAAVMRKSPGEGGMRLRCRRMRERGSLELLARLIDKWATSEEYSKPPAGPPDVGAGHAEPRATAFSRNV